jgi:diketogulonate reductase-like aldo/keto reductase
MKRYHDSHYANPTIATMALARRQRILLSILVFSQIGSGCSKGSVIPTKYIGDDVHGWPVHLPLLGAGTWQYNDTMAYESLCKAFGEGVTLVDTAFGYVNEKGVHAAIVDCFDIVRRPRSDLFVLTKVPGGLSFEETMGAHHQNLFQLQLDYVDHLMLHFPADWEENHASPVQRQEQWAALEEIYRLGQARSIGISHYCRRHIHDIVQYATVMPSINQVEYHVGSQDVDDVRDTCRQYNITFMSFSPLCGPCVYDDPRDSIIDGQLVTSIGRKYGVSGSQVSLRFIVQQALDGHPDSVMGAVIPKSNNIEHIRSNLDIFSFALSIDDMEELHRATKPAAERGDCDVP